MDVSLFILGFFAAAVILYCLACLLHSAIQKFWLFVMRRAREREFLKLLHDGKDVEIRIYDHEKILGIPIVECLHRKYMRRNVQYYPYNEKITFVNPVLKLVDGKVILVGGVVRRKNKPKRRISAETYLHYYDPPKPDLYRYDAKQGKYVLVPRKSSNQEQAV